jgi:hypothetical protein
MFKECDQKPCLVVLALNNDLHYMHSGEIAQVILVAEIVEKGKCFAPSSQQSPVSNPQNTPSSTPGSANFISPTCHVRVSRF